MEYIFLVYKGDKMKNKLSNKDIKYTILKNKVEELIYYLSDLIDDNNTNEDISLLVDEIFTEISNLRIGLELNSLKSITRNITLDSTVYIKEGKIKDEKLIALILSVQDELNNIKHIIKYPKKVWEKLYPLLGCISIIGSVILFIFAAIEKNLFCSIFVVLFFILFILCIVLTITTTQDNLKFSSIFSNLPYENCSLIYITKKNNKDSFFVKYKNGYAIAMNYYQDNDEYIINIFKDNNLNDILRSISVKKRYETIYVLKELMLEIEKM